MIRFQCSTRVVSLHCVGPLLLTVLLVTLLAGCQTLLPTETTGSVTAAPSRAEADWQRASTAWGERYRANPKDPETALNYAQALRGNGQR